MGNTPRRALRMGDRLRQAGKVVRDWCAECLKSGFFWAVSLLVTALTTLLLYVRTWLSKEVNVPLGLPVLLAVALVGCIIALIVMVVRRYLHDRIKVGDYREDDIFGVRWSWDIWQRGDFRPYCPKCDRRLLYQAANRYTDVTFTCPTGDFKAPMPGTWDETKGLLRIEVERKLRTGEWRAAVAAVRRRGRKPRAAPKTLEDKKQV
jgi:hypothetical protein